jgi:hypothetical protein
LLRLGIWNVFVYCLDWFYVFIVRVQFLGFRVWLLTCCLWVFALIRQNFRTFCQGSSISLVCFNFEISPAIFQQLESECIGGNYFALAQF